MKTVGAKRSVRTKANDKDIILLNNLGLSLDKIAEIVGVAPTTVSSRLRHNGIEPAKARKSFMEDIIKDLTPKQREWLAGKVSTSYPIQLFVKDLIIERFLTEQSKSEEDIKWTNLS